MFKMFHVITFSVLMTYASLIQAGDCHTLNIKFPLELHGEKLFCHGNSSEGSKGEVFHLINHKGEATPYALKVFYKPQKQLILDEIAEVQTGLDAKLPIPVIFESYTEGKEPKSIYIVKEFIQGVDAEELYNFGCFSPSDEYKELCKNITNVTPEVLHEKLDEFFHLVFQSDEHYFKGKGEYMTDLSGVNIRWDMNSGKFVLIDYAIGKGRTPSKTTSTILSDVYNRGVALFNKGDSTNIQGPKVECNNRFIIEQVLSKYIEIKKPVTMEMCASKT